MTIEELYIEYRPEIFKHCLSLCGNWHDAEDCASESFYHAIRDWNKFQDRGIPRTHWLKRISTRRCYALFNARKKRTEALKDEYFSGDISPESLVIIKQALQIVFGSADL
jgi:DNA-directed RNA polymerase specialized sigma24 family protein